MKGPTGAVSTQTHKLKLVPNDSRKEQLKPVCTNSSNRFVGQVLLRLTNSEVAAPNPESLLSTTALRVEVLSFAWPHAEHGGDQGEPDEIDEAMEAPETGVRPAQQPASASPHGHSKLPPEKARCSIAHVYPYRMQDTRELTCHVAAAEKAALNCPKSSLSESPVPSTPLPGYPRPRALVSS